MDREKVMHGLECCCEHIVGMSCGNCPYEIEKEDDGICDCTSVLAYDALTLLKEQQKLIDDITHRRMKMEHSIDRETVIKGMERFRNDLKPFCGNRADWERFDAGLAMLKDQEAEIRQLKLALDIAKGTCNGINVKDR